MIPRYLRLLFSFERWSPIGRISQFYVMTMLNRLGLDDHIFWLKIPASLVVKYTDGEVTRSH